MFQAVGERDAQTRWRKGISSRVQSPNASRSHSWKWREVGQ